MQDKSSSNNKQSNSNQASKQTIIKPSKNFFRASSIGQIYNDVQMPQSSLEATESYATGLQMDSKPNVMISNTTLP